MNEYDVIVLDWLLPGKDGIAVCRRLRARDLPTPILMLTARDSLADRVSGLEHGRRRLFDQAVRLRRAARPDPGAAPPLAARQPPFSGSTDLMLDPASRTVTRGGVKIGLTSKEYAILEVLMRNAGRDGESDAAGASACGTRPRKCSTTSSTST